MSDAVRLFVCVRPDDASVARYAELHRRLAGIGGVKWVPPSNVHVTLLFIGDVDAARAARLDSELSKLGGVRPFDVRVAGMGGFPDISRPKTLWLGVRSGAREMERLSSLTAKAASSAGVSFDKKRFRAHLTIGRARGEGAAMTDELRAAIDAAPEMSWRCESFALMRSELAPAGPTYTQLASYAL